MARPGRGTESRHGRLLAGWLSAALIALIVASACESAQASSRSEVKEFAAPLEQVRKALHRNDSKQRMHAVKRWFEAQKVCLEPVYEELFDPMGNAADQNRALKKIDAIFNAERYRRVAGVIDSQWRATAHRWASLDFNSDAADGLRRVASSRVSYVLHLQSTDPCQEAKRWQSDDFDEASTPKPFDHGSYNARGVVQLDAALSRKSFDLNRDLENEDAAFVRQFRPKPFS